LAQGVGNKGRCNAWNAFIPQGGSISVLGERMMQGGTKKTSLDWRETSPNRAWGELKAAIAEPRMTNKDGVSREKNM